MASTSSNTPPTANPIWDFYGTIGHHADPETA